MGTNYYLITKNSDIAHKYFANNDMYGTWDEEYALRDIPDFHYEIHLNKLSYGWRPLFQIHKVFRSFAGLEDFYKEHKSDLTISETEHKAQIKYGITDRLWNWRDRYKEDPDHKIDWVEGEFS